MSAIWSDEEKTLLESVRAVLSTREISKLFKELGYKRSIEAIQKMSRRLGVSFKDFGSPAVHGLTLEEKQALEAVLRGRDIDLAAIKVPIIPSSSARATVSKKKKEITIDILEELRDIREQVPRRCSISPKKAEGQDEESLVVLLSDWHLGQIIRDTEANREVYNSDIAIERIESIPEKVLSTLTEDRLMLMDECVLVLAGDMITGEGIFPHQEMYIHDHAVEQVLQATKATWSMIQGFRDIFPFVRVITTKGNHGRTGASPEANWDNMIYQQLELLIDLEDDSDLTIKNRYGNFTSVNIKGWKGLVRHHGPVQADTAAGVAKFAGWHGIHEWDLFMFGHWHHWGVMTWNGKPILRNGSLSGGDDYAESFAAYDDPVQLCFGITEENVCTFVNPVCF